MNYYDNNVCKEIKKIILVNNMNYYESYVYKELAKIYKIKEGYSIFHSDLNRTRKLIVVINKNNEHITFSFINNEILVKLENCIDNYDDLIKKYKYIKLAKLAFKKNILIKYGCASLLYTLVNYSIVNSDITVMPENWIIFHKLIKYFYC